MRLRVGFDNEELGRYQIRGGKIECVAPTRAAREELDRRLDMYMRQMVQDHGHDPANLTAEDVLRHIANHTGSGRNWTVLEDDTSAGR